ncbi:hypothetical protein PTKIN_Ptkin08bG0121600 [Pterospermum kingtungense]
MDIEPRCRVCDLEDDTWFHFLFECRVAVNIWRIALPSIFDWLNLTPFNDQFWDVLFPLVREQKSLELQMFVGNSGRIEMHVFDLKCGNPHVIYGLAKKLHEDFLEICVNPVILGPGHQTSWCPPAVGRIKNNVDTAWYATEQNAVVVAVARSDRGVVVCCATQKINFVEAVLHAELLALRFGCEMAFFNNLQRIDIESDSFLPIREIDKGHDTFCKWAGLI